MQLLGPASRSVFLPFPFKNAAHAIAASGTEQMAHRFERHLTKTWQTESFEADRVKTTSP